MNRQYGISLLEIIIVVAIISIITAVAWPFYERYRVKAYRSECIAALYMVANDLEKCASQTGGVYTDYRDPVPPGAPPVCTPSSVRLISPQADGITVLSANNRCTVTIAIDGGGAGFTLTGAYIENVVDDADEILDDSAECGDLTLNNLNVKAMTNRPPGASASVAYCWDE